MQPFQLHHSILTSAEIECNICGIKDNIQNADEWEAADYFYSQGWRSPRMNKVYCRQCAKKKLKSKK